MGNFVGPLLTMILTYEAGLDVGIVGIITAINAGAGMLGTLLGGKLIDQIGRKRVLVIFRTLAGIGFGLCAFTSSSVMMVGLLMVARFFGGFSGPVYDTMIADLTEGEQRKTSYSLNYMAINVGYAIGPLLAGFLYKHYLTWLFLGDAMTTFLSVVLVMSLVPETMPTKDIIEKSHERGDEKIEQGNLFQALLKRPMLCAFSLIVAIYFMIFNQVFFAVPIKLGELFAEDGAIIFGSLITINAVMCSVFTAFVNAATSKLKPALAMSYGGIFYGVGFGILIWADNYTMFVISTVIWTIGEILISINTSVYIADHTPISHRGRFNSVFPLIRRLGAMIGPIVGGLILKGAGQVVLWAIIGLFGIIAALCMLLLYRLEVKRTCTSEENLVQ
jgi:MFS family permease